MAQRQLTPLQQEVINLLQQGYVGEFFSHPRHAYGGYTTEAYLKKGINTHFTRYTTIKALEAKGYVKITKDQHWTAGTFELLEAS